MRLYNIVIGKYPFTGKFSGKKLVNRWRLFMSRDNAVKYCNKIEDSFKPTDDLLIGRVYP